MTNARRRARGLAAGILIATVGCASVGAATLVVEVAGADGGAMDDAVVWVMPATGRAPVRALPAAVIDQVRKEFVPLVSVLPVGTSVRFPNRDNLRHHVYSFSPAKRFEIRLYSGEPADPVVFDKPGLVVLGCNIHDHMVAYVMVVDTPWFALSETDGRARIAALPPGDYVVAAWHRRAGDESTTVRQPLKVSADTVVTIVLPTARSR